MSTAWATMDDEYAAIRQDAQPSQSEQCADWLGIPPDTVGEDDLMRWLDWVRDCEEMGNVA